LSALFRSQSDPKDFYQGQDQHFGHRHKR
jgi:hypothetical protein